MRQIVDIKEGENIIGEPGRVYTVVKYRSSVIENSIFGKKYKCPICNKELESTITRKEPDLNDTKSRGTWIITMYKCNSCGYHNY